ncbi:MAG: M14 family zinc carboxypeptidase [Desulfobacterales bacterium]
MPRRINAPRFSYLLIIFCVSALILPSTLPAAMAKSSSSQGAYWKNEPEEEAPPPYETAIPYSQIASKLREIEVNSNRVKVDVIGQSAGGRDLFLVTLSAPEAIGRLGRYQAIRNTMLKDPEKAQEMIDKFGDFKVPVFVNGSIHGNEYEGVDAAIRLIETLAFGDSEEVQTILKNVILLVNVVQNPDGRVMGTRSNAKGIDVNRDFITQTQPETRATVKVITEWNPMVFLDLHDDVQPMLIEPCSPPHNPNYEYDLYIQWALYQAYAMEAELIANTDETEALIPFRDWDFTFAGYTWDDWPPIYTPMYAMYHGAYGHTLETPYEDERGVDAHYWAVWGALKFVAENRQAMVRDQIEIFRRGFLDLPQALIPDYILAETQYDQFNELTIQKFPAAYIIPPDTPMQLSSHQPARLVDFLLFNDVQVEKASQAFMYDGMGYPKGTYIVWMDQPKRGLANAILEDGLDVSNIQGIEFYSPPTAWSHPLLWGVYRARMEAKQTIKTSAVDKADPPSGSVANGKGDYYAYLMSSDLITTWCQQRI